MDTVKKINIDPAEIRRVKFGLKWSPKERDFQKVIRGENNDAFLSITSVLSMSFNAWLFVENKINPFFGDKPSEEILKEQSGVDVSSLTKEDRKKIEKRVIKRLKEHENKVYVENIKNDVKVLRESTESHDLDLLCLAFDAENRLVEYVSPLLGTEINETLSISSSGDDLDGVGSYDDEDIAIQLNDVPKNVQNIFILVDSLGRKFSEIEGDVCQAYNPYTNEKYFTHDLADDEKEDGKSFVFSRLTRDNETWTLQNISEYVAIDYDDNQDSKHVFSQIIRKHFL
jgi:stress response protein SCP2